MSEKTKAETIQSTSDERVKNNVLRHEYRVLSDTEKSQLQELKDRGLDLLNIINSLPTSRETSLAVTNVEQAIMWAVKSLTK